MIMYDTIAEPATRVDWTAVDQIVFIIPDLSRRFHRANEGVTTPETVVRLDVDTPRFELPKSAGASRRIGMLGFYEERKGPDVAVRLLERLREIDSEYRLHFKGEHPWQRSYVWSRAKSRHFTMSLYSMIQRSGLADGITFSPHSRDVAGWFVDIGIILSASNDESCHLAVAEGMASGAVPIIRNWNDADWMYPATYVLPYDEDAFIDAAVGRICELRDNGRLDDRREESIRYAREYFDTCVVAGQYDRMFNEILNGRPAVTSGE
jgi:glycosyltransferase involved in cell wall biosynthesis